MCLRYATEIRVKADKTRASLVCHSGAFWSQKSQSALTSLEGLKESVSESGHTSAAPETHPVKAFFQSCKYNI